VVANGGGDLVIDTTVAHVARVYDYMLGGDANFAVDREAAERSAEPVGGIDAWRYSTHSNRAFLGRVVRWLVEEHGVHQFLDLGSGLPTERNVHEVAQAAAPECLIVYVDFDSVVLAHAHQLLEGTTQGATAFLAPTCANRTPSSLTPPEPWTSTSPWRC
jgi:S-adenosyl methyltransferase